MMNITNINITFTKINTLDKKCSMSLTKSYQQNKNVTNKRNEGFGEETGDSVTILNANQWIDDRDLVDCISKKANQ